MKAKDCKCIKCGEQAVAFYPVELDMISYPYCRECLDALQLSLLIKFYESKTKIQEFKPIEHKNLKSPE